MCESYVVGMIQQLPKHQEKPAALKSSADFSIKMVEEVGGFSVFPQQNLKKTSESVKLDEHLDEHIPWVFGLLPPPPHPESHHFLSKKRKNSDTCGSVPLFLAKL